ncbi:MAG: hypothetical protein ACK5Q5_18210 [Planctomycetaceae bacterium]
MSGRLLAVIVCMSLLGCGGAPNDAPPLFPVNGSVDFDGQPLVEGTIYFEPLPPNAGPPGRAKIRDGKFDTENSEEPGKGHVGGKMLVRVIPEGTPPESDPEATIPLPFPEWSLELDLPQQPSTQEIHVPKEASNPKPIRRPANEP